MTASHAPQDPVSVVINVYNEAETIESEIRAIHEQIVTRLPGSELIVAEDGSTDGTKEIILRLKEELGLIHSTSEERKGYAKALQDAFMLARCEYIFFSDTGGKHDMADFWTLYPHRSEYELVIGVKTNRQDQKYRQILTWGYNRVLCAYFGVHLTDADSGFRLYRKSAARQVFSRPLLNKDLIASEIALRVIFSGGHIKEVPVSYRQRAGVSRGLPIERVLGVMYRVLGNFPRLKKELQTSDAPLGDA